jgi:hypothetical protein
MAQVVSEPAMISRETSQIRSTVLKRAVPVVLCARKKQQMTSDLVQLGPSVIPVTGTAKRHFPKGFYYDNTLNITRTSSSRGGVGY